MKNIDRLLSELVKGSTHIISSPNTIETLQKRGVKFETKTKLREEFIEEVFTQRRNLALVNISKFPEPPDIAIPTIGFLYDEIRECILFGLYGAAISLSAVLVEFSLKHAIVRKDFGNEYNKVEWERIENIELGPIIKEAREKGVIDDKLQEALNDFKSKVRNPYLHYNIKKIVKKVGANKVKKIDINTQKIEELNLPAEDNPILWGFAKRFVDRETVFDVFKFADTVVKQLFVNNK
ncbi:MAG: hypothetical protein AAB531_01950 [Patescibacteria group bacterium]